MIICNFIIELERRFDLPYTHVPHQYSIPKKAFHNLLVHNGGGYDLVKMIIIKFRYKGM